MSKKPLVSIAVPSFNYGNFLKEALQSILNQKIDFEILLSDGGSSDNSIQIIREFQNELNWLEVEKDRGQSHAINKALQNANGKYFCWLCADDFYLNNSLYQITKALDLSPEHHWAYANCVFLNQAAQSTYLKVPGKFSRDKLARSCFIHQPSTIIRTEALKELGGLTEELHYAMDYDLWWRLYWGYGEPLYVKSSVAVNRDHGNTKTNNFRQEQFIEAMTTVKKYNGHCPITWHLKKPYSVYVRTLKKKIYENFTSL